VAANVRQRRRAGGHTWALRQWALGLRQAGAAAVVVDPSARRQPGAARRARSSRRPSSPARPHRRTASAAAVLNIMGALSRDERAHDGVSVFVDIDPGYPQMWRELGLADMLAGHDRFVTIGENIGQDGCAIPTCGIDWITTPPPVALDAWTPGPPGGRAFTTVATWRNDYGTVAFDGVTYGSRVHEFRKFFELPRLVDAEFELALDIDRAETADLKALAAGGWRLVDPRRVAGTAQAYRAYIHSSRAELCVAQNMYVATRSGWLSDRSLCYLAAGKPVLAQDTGFSARYPVGEGLIAFSTLEEAAAGVEEIERDYERHSRAARALAEEYFDAGKVLARLLERLELTQGVPAR
jgi:hypothetical protein